MTSTSKLPRIPEILRLICEELEDDKPALAALARTSKDFQEPALNVLWFELDNFYPLAKCLPPHTWVEEERDEEGWLKLWLQQPIDQNDCARLLHYAARVRWLISDFDYDTDWVDSTVFQGLQTALEGLHYPNVIGASSSPVINVKLKFSAIEPAESWKTLFNCMVDHFDHFHLQDLFCSDGERDHIGLILDEPGPKREIIHFQEIEPLLVFRNLKQLNISVTRGFYFLDPTITITLASRWNSIEKLNLIVKHGPMRTQMAPPTCTLKDLLPFAEHCPRLMELGLPLDASSPPEIPTHKTENRPPRQSSLTKLLVVEGPIGYVPLVAANLSGTFPSLTKIDYLPFRTLLSHNGDEGERVFMKRMSDWTQVQRLVRVMSSVRAEEQFYIADREIGISTCNSQ